MFSAVVTGIAPSRFSTWYLWALALAAVFMFYPPYFCLVTSWLPMLPHSQHPSRCVCTPQKLPLPSADNYFIVWRWSRFYFSGFVYASCLCRIWVVLFLLSSQTFPFVCFVCVLLKTDSCSTCDCLTLAWLFVRLAQIMNGPYSCQLLLNLSSYEVDLVILLKNIHIIKHYIYFVLFIMFSFTMYVHFFTLNIFIISHSSFYYIVLFVINLF